MLRLGSAAVAGAALANVRAALVVCAMLAALALLTLLLRLRVAFAALFGMALSLVAATALLDAFGYAINPLVTLGLLLGLCVVVTESAGETQAIASRLEAVSAPPASSHDRGQGTLRLVAAACGELRGALTGAGLAAVACVVPLLVVTGTTAGVLRPVAAAFALAVAVALVAAVTVTPALAAVLLTILPSQTHGTPPPRRLAAAYARALRSLAGAPPLALGCAALFIAAGFAALLLLPGLHPGQPVFTAGGTPRAAFVCYVIAALIGVLLLARAATGSWPLAAVAFGSLPACLAGAVFVVYGLGAAGSLAAAAGVLAVFALAVRQALAVTARAARGADGGLADGLAIVLTPAVVTAVAVAPFAVIGAVPGMELLHTAAVVILGGLATTTLVSLFGLPVAVLRIGRGALARPA